MQQNTKLPVEELVRSTGLIFAGTVVELGGSSVSAVKAAENLIVVRVDRGLRVDKALGELRGKMITVDVRDPKAFPTRSAGGVLHQQLDPRPGHRRPRSRARRRTGAGQRGSGRRQVAGDHLTDRLRARRLVVHAEVVRVGPVERVSLDRNDALVANRRTECAPRASRNAALANGRVFPDLQASRLGARAALHRTAARRVRPPVAVRQPNPSLAALPAGALVVLDADDFQPESRLADVERLVGAIK